MKSITFLATIAALALSVSASTTPAIIHGDTGMGTVLLTAPAPAPAPTPAMTNAAMTNATAAATASHATPSLNKRRLQFFAEYAFCGVDTVGPDVATFASAAAAGCMSSCKQSAPGSTCRNMSWTNLRGGTCFIKNQISGTMPKADVDSFIVNDSASADPPLFTWRDELRDVSLPHNDLVSTKGDGIAKCKTDCEANPNCFAVTWTSHDNGTCWLKKRATAAVTKAGSVSAYLGRRANTLATPYTCPK